MSEQPLRAVGLGQPGFVGFLHGLAELGVIDREELRAWLRLHGSVVRRPGPPLDAGDGIPDELLDRLQEELGG
jgi:hypothetical protein